MRCNRLGCLTGTGTFATLITALAIFGVAFAQGNMMFSAGPLNAQSKGHLVGKFAKLAIQCPPVIYRLLSPSYSCPIFLSL